MNSSDFFDDPFDPSEGLFEQGMAPLPPPPPRAQPVPGPSGTRASAISEGTVVAASESTVVAAVTASQHAIPRRPKPTPAYRVAAESVARPAGRVTRSMSRERELGPATGTQ